MTTKILPHIVATVAPAQSNKIAPTPHLTAFGVFRLSTDPLYYADLTLQNVVADTRYRVTRASNGAELALGIGGGGDIVISGVPCFTNPMLVNIKLRNASGATKYKPFETSAYIYKTGGSAYIIQVED